MNVLINFSTLKKGGGLNVSMNFLHAFRAVDCPFKLYFMVSEGTPQLCFLQSIGYNYFIVVPSHPLKRIFWELTKGGSWLQSNNISLVYSYFGYAFFPKRFLQINGSADSNLYFPEINFWGELSNFSKLKKWFIDKYRLYCVKRASAVVFENPIMKVRAKELYNIDKSFYIRPSINDVEIKGCVEQDYNFGGGFKVLFLCDWHSNKNVKLIPELLFYAKNAGFDLKVVISAEYDGSIISDYVKDKIQQFDLQDRFFLIGKVRKEELRFLYSSIDVVALLSLLESFSNNIIEAWFYKKPLVISNEPWARAICNEAAFYVERNSVESVLEGIKSSIFSSDEIERYHHNAELELHKYPSIKERIATEYKLMLEVAKQ